MKNLSEAEIKILDEKFEDFICTRNDDIDNATFHLINTLCAEEQEWDMAIIGDCTDAVEEVLKKHGKEVCWPSFDSEDDGTMIPCYRGEECKNVNCPMKEHTKSDSEEK